MGDTASSTTGYADDELQEPSKLAQLLAWGGRSIPGMTAAPWANDASAPAPSAYAPARASAMPAPAANPKTSTGVPVDPGSQTNIPQAPQFKPVDVTKRAELAKAVQQNQIPTDPKKAAPHWWDRLLGAGVGFGVGYKQGPVAGIEAGGAVTNRRYNQAEAQRMGRLNASETALGNFDAESQIERQNFQGAQDVFEDEYKRSQEARMQGEASSRAQERNAKAEKYENAIDPNSIEQGEDGKWYGTTYGGEKKETGAPKYAQQRPATEPKTYEELVIAAENVRKNDPAKAAAYDKAARRLEQTEIKKFKFANGNQNPSNRTELSREEQVNKADENRQKAFQKLEDDPMLKRNPKELTRRKQAVENAYSQALNTLGVKYDPVQYNEDGTSSQGGSKPQSRADRASGGRQQNKSATQPIGPTSPAQGERRKSRPDTITIDGTKYPVTKVARDANGAEAYLVNGRWVKETELRPIE